MENKKVFVTGADGFIGSHLCENLVSKGYHVKALAAYNSFGNRGWLDNIDKKTSSSLEIVAGDIRDRDFIFKSTEEVDIIFHLASLIAIPYSYHAPQSYIETNVMGALNIYQAALNNNCERIISTSTSEVYGSARRIPITENHPIQAQSPYAATKISADHLLESFVLSFGLPAVILRPFNTYGPRQSERAIISSIIRQLLDKNSNFIKVGNLEPKRDFNYVDDTVSAFILLANLSEKKIKYGTVYNAGSGKSYSMKYVLQKLINITNSKKNIIVEDKRVRPKKSEVLNLVASSKKLNLATGWSPKVKLEEGLKKTIKWWTEYKRKNRLRDSSEYVL
ncbi:MAG: NAD-dependent dehydratase [Pelagibacterales bacterium]|nr:NAD-dependent dehydratase [Pelagibacterales bacterium]|tara:strand:+ start:2404 stop:3411 length:1008 start_codon:yes stop_codon:yes gene_type:complete